MGPLIDFDPSSAVQFWFDQKKRHPHVGQKSKEQQWFMGVFPEAKSETKVYKRTVNF